MVLIIVMIVATLLLIGLTAALPSVYQEGRREREAELIFRGTQYARAVALFHKQFSRYPATTKELLQTNGIRFLRQEYRDPMDPKGKWRFIHVNAAGVLIDSKNQPLGGNNCNPAGLGQTGSTSSMQMGSSSMGTSSFGTSSLGNSSTGCSNSTGLQGTSGTGASSPTGDSSSTGLQSGSSGMGMNSPLGSSQIGPTSSFLGNSSGVQGAFIAGVAATTNHESIRIWQKHHHYDEWEFIGLDMGIFGMQIGMPSSSSGPTGMGQQSTPLGSSFSPGGSQGSSGSTTSSPTTFGPSSN